jgi:Putative porin
MTRRTEHTRNTKLGLTMSSIRNTAYRPRTLLLSISLLAVAAALPAFSTSALAQEGAEPAQEEMPTVSKKKAVASSSTINLVNLLVEQGVLSEEQAQALIKQAEDEAYVAREAARDATEKAAEASKAASDAAAAASPPGSKRVAYVPEVVKRQLREELRKEVMSQAKDEGWASPGLYPEWASRIRLSGDLRGRFEGIWFPEGDWNAPGTIYDFNSINTGSPYDASVPNKEMYPTYNNTEDRNRARLRARIGLDAELGEGFSAGMRIATGSDSSPVSTNQTLGGSGGNFSKYELWLDRAFVKFEPFQNEHLPDYSAQGDASLSLGRFDNPFWAPTDLVWDGDLGFDGLAANGSYFVNPTVTVFGTAGAFPIFNTSLDFSTTEARKFSSEDKYLFGGQAGVAWQATPDIAFNFGAGIYEFSNVQGELSSPCDTWRDGVTACDTDHTRPSFAQKGNTYMALRQITKDPNNLNNNQPLPQYFGLSSEFRPVVLSARAEFAQFDPVRVWVDGDFVWNSAFDEDDIKDGAINNRGDDPDGPGNLLGDYEGGNLGWMARLSVGNPKLKSFGDWNAFVGYKYLESDAVLDAFADSDFGLGGTNLKGYMLGGSYALSEDTNISAKWMSADAIVGFPYAVDTFQLDFNAKF